MKLNSNVGDTVDEISSGHNIHAVAWLLLGAVERHGETADRHGKCLGWKEKEDA